MLLLQKHELAPNVMAMVGAFNRVALLVPTEILQETTPQARAKVISVFIQVGIQLVPFLATPFCFISLSFSSAYS